MLVCVACYGERVAALLETASELRFYAQGAHGTARPGAVPSGVEERNVMPLPAAVQQLGLSGLISLLEDAGAAVLLCGGLTCCALEALRNSGVHVVPWIGGTADEAARAWCSGSIQTLKMPGCLGCGGKRRRRGGRNRRMEMMDMRQGILAVTSEGPKLTDMVDPRFGRAAGFVVVDLATNKTSYVDNGGSQVMAQGAGIQAAENVARAGAGFVLSGFVGPKAFQALTAGGIQVIQNVEGMTVGQAVDKFKRGELSAADAPNAPAGGHPGGGRKG
jgi:predicted Fe-Mo cluster-binding NifX family protein